MADKDFDTIDQLMSYVYDQVEQVMETIIADFIEQKLRESVEVRVFETYSPILYERRSLNSDNEGLLNCWEKQINKDGNTIRLIIENTATKVWENSSSSLAELIEYGSPQSQGQPWLESRHFIEPVVEELKASGDLERILQQSLDFLI